MISGEMVAAEPILFIVLVAVCGLIALAGVRSKDKRDKD